MKFLILFFCLSVSAAPVPSPASLIDINANNNDLKFPINVLGVQGNDVNALNDNLNGNSASASNGQTNNVQKGSNGYNSNHDDANVNASNAKTGGTTITNNVNTNHASNSLVGANTNGNKLAFPINVLGVQGNGVTALNGNVDGNSASASNRQTNNDVKAAEPSNGPGIVSSPSSITNNINTNGDADKTNPSIHTTQSNGNTNTVSASTGNTNVNPDGHDINNTDKPSPDSINTNHAATSGTNKTATATNTDNTDAKTDKTINTDAENTATNVPGNALSQSAPTTDSAPKPVPNKPVNNVPNVITGASSPAPNKALSPAQPGPVNMSSVVNAVNGLTAALNSLTSVVGQAYAQQE